MLHSVFTYRHTRILGVGLLVISYSLIAQETTSKATAGKVAAVPNEEVLTLSRFQVNEDSDVGYRATQTVSGTRFKTEIKDLPMAMQVITSQFLEDTNATNIYDALQFVSSVSEEGSHSAAYGSSGLRVRGFYGARLRNGFARPGGGPTGGLIFENFDNIDRVEVVKGPSSVLYGQSGPGGAVNYITKRPELKQKTVTNVTFGSYDFKKAMIDSTGPIATDKLSYRFIGSYQDNNDRRDDEHKEAQFSNMMLRWNPTKQLSVFLEAEHLHMDQLDVPLLVMGYLPYLSITPAPASPPASRTPFPFFTESLRPDLSPRGWKANRAGKDSYKRDWLDTSNAEITYAFNPQWTLRSANNYVSGESSGALNFRDNFLQGGEQYLVTFVGNRNLNRAFSSQNDLVGQLDLGGMKHTLLLGDQYSKATPRTQTANWSRNNYARRYDDPTPLLIQQYLTSWTPPLGATIKGNAYYVSDLISMFNKRLTVMVGQRWEKSTRTPFGGASIVDKASLPQAGAIFKITDHVDVFSSYSESFSPNNNINPDGAVLGPQIGKGYEAGVRVELNDRATYLTATVFRSERTGIPVTDVARSIADPLNRQFLRLTGLERVNGIEFDGIFSVGRNTQMMLSYSAMDAHVITSDLVSTAALVTPAYVGEPVQGKRLLSVPPQAASIWTRYQFEKNSSLGGLAFGGGVKYVSNGRAASARPDLVRVMLPGYAVGDVFVEYSRQIFGKRSRFRLNASNVTDKRYYAGIETVVGEARKIYLSAETQW